MKNMTFAISLCLGLGFLACKQQNEAEQTATEKTDIFKVINPLVTDTAYVSEYVAEIQSLQNVEIRTKMQGFLTKIFVDEGQAVRQGQSLFQLGNQELQQELAKNAAALKSAEAEARSAQLEVQNTKLLVDKNVVSKTELELAQAKLDVLNAKIEEVKAEKAGIELQISFTEIRAPFDGTINLLPKKAGSLISEGDLLTTLSNNREMLVYFNISEKEYLEFTAEKTLQKTADATLVLANGETYPQRGKIETVTNEFNPETGNIAVRARFPNPSGLLKHGETGKVLMQRQVKNALIIPQKATFEVQDKMYVFVVDGEGTVRQRSIVPALKMPNLYLVGEGLSATDKVIFEGIQLVKEGDKVNAELVPVRQVLQ
jgi:RND family efflux transporter MFP subunit